MFSSLSISNFRNLDHLQLNSLAKVNLITGKNNTGKSTLLEAIAIIASNGDFSVIEQLLEERGENYPKFSNTKNIAEANLKAVSSLFSKRLASFNDTNSIIISALDKSSTNQATKYLVKLRLVKFIDELTTKGDDLYSNRKRTILDDSDQQLDYKTGLQLITHDASYLAPFDNDRFFRKTNLRNPVITDLVQFIRPHNIDRDNNGKLWDKITLTPGEQQVVEALRIIEKDVERIAFVEEGNKSRSAVVKLTGVEAPMPLQSMGDGINRVLTIILALVNAENRYLLIDEFENGLHHSVQLKLWELIFTLATKLNVQIFATTHSNDCIAAFQEMLNSSNVPSHGKLIRLSSTNGNVVPVEYTSDELKIAIENDIETR